MAPLDLGEGQESQPDLAVVTASVDALCHGHPQADDTLLVVKMAVTPCPLPLIRCHGYPLASDDDSRDRQALALARESEEPGGSIGWAVRR